MIQATQSSCLLEYLMVILHTSIEWSCKIKKKIYRYLSNNELI